MSGHGFLSGLVEGDVALLIDNGQHQLLPHLASNPHGPQDLFKRKRGTLRDHEDIKLGRRLSRMAPSRINPEIRPSRLNNVPPLAEVLVDHVPELESFLQGRGDLEKGLEVQLQVVGGGKDTDPGSVEEI